jgi:hypothetical protein
MFHHTWSVFLAVSHACSRIVTLRHHSLLFVLLVQYRVVFGCSFHVVTHCHAVMRSHALPCVIINFHSWSFFSRLSLLLIFHHIWSLSLTVVTLSHALPRFVPLIYPLLRLFLPSRSLLRFSRCRALSRVMMVTLGRCLSRLSPLSMYFHTW